MAKSKPTQPRSGRGQFVKKSDGHGSPLSVQPKVFSNPKSLSGRREASHAKAYTDDGLPEY